MLLFTILLIGKTDVYTGGGKSALLLVTLLTGKLEVCAADRHVDIELSNYRHTFAEGSPC